MNKLNSEIPDHMKKPLRAMLLSSMDCDTLDVFEIQLFEWYVKEAETTLKKMLETENSYIEEQISIGIEDINDSGIVAVEYYSKRIRYSHIIYLTSLLESCLERACTTLTVAVGKENIPFSIKELKDDQWSKKRKYLERYGKFELPNQCWSELQTLIKVRNFLVHENGDTNNLSEELKHLLNECQGLDVSRNEFKIEESYIQSSFQSVKLFVNSVEKQVNLVIQRIRQL